MVGGPAGGVTLRFVVAGLVQGVGYRFFVQRRATELGLSGWVRNLPDGRVEILSRGEPTALESLEAHLRQGPTHGRVDHVEKFETLDEACPAKGFDIKR